MKKNFLILLFICGLCFDTNALTTVISHGYNFPGIDPVKNWMMDMAEAICNRHKGGVIYIYESKTGSFEEYKRIAENDSNKILLFDWMKDSNDPEKGHSEAAGNALFCALIEGNKEQVFNIKNLHMIGHSRGCVVNSEASERLIKLGVEIDQLTFLDPHDWGLYVTHTDHYVNSESLASGIVSWNGIKWADSYWHDAKIGLSGRAIDGTISRQLKVIRHGDLYKWYTKSIHNPKLKEGYYFSQLGGGKDHRKSISTPRHNPEFDFISNGIFNGDFSFKPPMSKKIPGWAHHGGKGSGHVYNGQLELDFADSRKTHDRVYVHPSVTTLVFDLKRTNSDNYPRNDVDQLTVWMNEDKVLSMPLNETDETFQPIRIDIKKYRDKIITFSFKIRDEYDKHTFINSEVQIDNVRFE